MFAQYFTSEDRDGWNRVAATADLHVWHRILPPVIPAGHGELILVVDDDDPVRELITTILERNGYRVVSCGDGLEAIGVFDALSAEIPAVVTDVEMPRIGGVDFARAIMQAFPDTRVVAMSGRDEKWRLRPDFPPIQELAHAYLPKPFKVEELLWTLHRVLHPVETSGEHLL
jgi:CheY-like chemotaxis protein